jgi:hypothetical protein
VNSADAIAELTAACAERVAQALRALLEHKHLYQSVQVAFSVSTNFEAAAKVLSSEALADSGLLQDRIRGVPRLDLSVDYEAALRDGG